MKKINFFLIVLLYTSQFFPQSNLIQSIDIDSQQRVVYGLTGNYDSSYVCRYKDGVLEKWNLTRIFNESFFWISTAVDKQDNIWAFMQNTLYKFDGSSWWQFKVPSPPTTYQKYSDLAIDDENLWLSLYLGGIYNDKCVYRFKIKDSSWTIFNSSNSNFPSRPIIGTVFLKGDSTFVSTTQGLVLICNDSANVILDTTNSTLGTQEFYCFYIDSKGNKWISTIYQGLVKWIDNSTFINYDVNNSNLPNNFINAIDEDSKGNIWLATDRGLACFRNDTIISYSDLYNYSVATLKIDKEDKIWFGYFGEGNLLYFDGFNITTVTAVNEQPNHPRDFYLLQNYPNPFNPVTNIGFRIAESGLVTLKVYDILGKEVATLVNEEKGVGNYEVEFNASGLASGIYFYTLTTGNFTATKKLILIR